MNSEEYNEEELRTKVIIPLLVDIGFSFNNIELETSFSIQLGRGIYDLKNDQRKFIGGRLDVLCKADKVNLFIIELKADDVEIDLEKDRKQGLSYARLLDPMPPYVIVTNGKRTFLFDTITGKEVDNTSINLNGFKIAIDSEISLKYEALKSFIGYSSNNLKIFCNTFNEKYLQNFRSKFNDSSEQSLLKKYIPETYTNRGDIIDKFKAFLDDSNSCIFSIIGESGVGKTNTIINISENFIEHPAIFYSGTLLGESLLDELKFDFNLEFSPYETELSLIKKICSLTEKNDKPFIIYIDALDEWIAKNKINQLENITKILFRYKIKLCVSCKDLVWQSFLTQQGIPTLFSKYLFPVYKLENFNESELILAVNKYSEKFNLQVDKKNLSSELSNPFSLRMACEVSFIKDIAIDLSQNARDTLDFFIKQKIQKTTDPQKIQRFIFAICKILLEEDVVQIRESIIRKELGLSINEEMPIELFSSNLLYKNITTDSHEFYIGFYFSKIRDHILSVDVLNLNNKFDTDRIDTILNSLSSYIGENAINYFLRTGTEIEQGDCILALIKYDEKTLKSSLFKLLAQQESKLLNKINNGTLQIILNHALFILEKIKNPNIIGKEITTVLKVLSVNNDLDSFLIEVLRKLDQFRENNYDISPDICRILQTYDNPTSTAELISILLNTKVDERIRRFVIDSLEKRTLEDQESIYRALLGQAVNRLDNGVFFYVNNWYILVETVSLRNELLDYFDKTSLDSFQNLLLHSLMDSQLKDTGEKLFSRFLTKKYSLDVTCWLSRAICGNNYRPAISKFIELLIEDPTSPLADHILIGLGEMNAKETMPALFKIIENLNEKVDLWWLSMSFTDIAEIEDYEALVDIYKKTDNTNTKYFILLTLSQTRNSKYNYLIINSLKDNNLSTKNRSRIISEWGSSLTSIKDQSYNRVILINNEQAKDKLEENEIQSLYTLFEDNSEVSIYALYILMNFDVRIERLCNKIQTNLPNINHEFSTSQISLINVENIKLVSKFLNPWLEMNFRNFKWSNKNFLFNCLQFAGIFGDNKVLESIRSNRDKIINQYKYDERFIEFIEFTIRTSGNNLRLRLDQY